MPCHISHLCSRFYRTLDVALQCPTYVPDSSVPQVPCHREGYRLVNSSPFVVADLRAVLLEKPRDILTHACTTAGQVGRTRRSASSDWLAEFVAFAEILLGCSRPAFLRVDLESRRRCRGASNAEVSPAPTQGETSPPLPGAVLSPGRQSTPRTTV